MTSILLGLPRLFRWNRVEYKPRVQAFAFARYLLLFPIWQIHFENKDIASLKLWQLVTYICFWWNFS